MTNQQITSIAIFIGMVVVFIALGGKQNPAIAEPPKSRYTITWYHPYGNGGAAWTAEKFDCDMYSKRQLGIYIELPYGKSKEISGIWSIDQN